MELRPGHGVEYLNSLGDGRLPGYLGVVITDVRPGVLLAELPLREQLFAPNGYLHAGSVVTLADTAAGYACLAHLPEGATFTTLELKVNFVRALREGVLRCEARAVHLGRTTHVWDAIVRGDADELPVAVFRCTQLVLYPS
jgi:1,4-dihydroxy-2-naphthoyl-CoA hydrolase